MIIDRYFVVNNLLSKNGNLNPRALSKYGITKEQAYNAMHNIDEPAKCLVCAKNTKLISFNKGYQSYCSNSCSSKHDVNVEKRNIAVKAKYGELGLKHPSVQEKKRNTNKKRFGVDWARQSTVYIEELKSKWVETHGVTSFSHTPDAVEKRNKTNLEKYGYVNPAQNEKVRKQIEETNLLKYNSKTPLTLSKNRKKALNIRRDNDVYKILNDKEWLEANKDISSVTLSESLGVAWSTILNYFKKHNVDRSSYVTPSTEAKIHDILNSLEVEYEVNNRKILEGKEIDIYIPTHRIGIEVNGVYWHSDQFIKDSNYHLNKTLLSNSKSVNLIHIFSTEIDTKLDIVRARLISKLGLSCRIFARKCEIKEISNKEYTSYMNKHHIQGYAPASVRIALIYKNEISAVMSFAKSRYNKQYEWELIRYASENTVVGGASKLINYFKKVYNPTSIISYADVRWNTGTMYEKIGLEFSHISSPNYWYLVNDKLVHRTAFQKHKLQDKLDIFDSNKTEWENMEINNIYKVWDCGNYVYTWRSKQ